MGAIVIIVSVVILVGFVFAIARSNILRWHGEKRWYSDETVGHVQDDKKLISDTIQGKPLLLYWNNTVGQRLAESGG
ncbi:MAG: hypothetical protein K2F87_06065 [Muribaculaceae bacterium]|nr:hypothetical protein [Muribaculaceae bacterium]